MIAAVATMVVTTSACTLAEWNDENVLRKAVIVLDFGEKIDQVHLQLWRSGQSRIYRDTLLSGVGEGSVEVTYLYNGHYRANALVCDQAGGVVCLEDGTTVVSAAKDSRGRLIPVGEVLWGTWEFDIVKGDRKKFTPQQDTITTAMSVEVNGLEWIDQAELLSFEYDYMGAMTTQGRVWSEGGTADYETYCPAVTITDGRMSGAWHTIFDSALPEMTIRLVYPDGRVLYERTFEVQTEEGKLELNIDINIEFTPTHIHATVGEWSETVERVTVDFQ